MVVLVGEPTPLGIVCCFRQAVAGEVLIHCTYKGERTPRHAVMGARGMSLSASFEAESVDDQTHQLPALHWLQVRLRQKCCAVCGVVMSVLKYHSFFVGVGAYMRVRACGATLVNSGTCTYLYVPVRCWGYVWVFFMVQQYFVGCVFRCALLFWGGQLWIDGALEPARVRFCLCVYICVCVIVFCFLLCFY